MHMMLWNRILRVAFALSIVGAIASQVPVTGETALANNKCTNNNNREYRVGRNGSTKNAVDVYTAVTPGDTYTGFLYDASTTGTYTPENSSWSITGTGWTLTNSSGTTTAIATAGSGPATLRGQSTTDPTLVVTVTLTP